MAKKVSRERAALLATTAASIDVSALRVGMNVQAWAHKDARFWAAVVTNINQEGGECSVTVRYTGCGTADEEQAVVTIHQLRPYDFVETVNGKRARKPATPAHGKSDSESESDDVAGPAEDNGAQKQQNKRQGRKSVVSDGTDVVHRILDHKGEGESKQYFTQFQRGDCKWLQRADFFDSDGTVTAAFLAYEWEVDRIVMTWADDAELLVAWRNRSSSDWVRVPVTAFNMSQLAQLRANPTDISRWERQNGVETIYQGIHKAMRDYENRHVALNFPTYLAAHILGGIGTPLAANTHDQRHYGDQKLHGFTRADLQTIFAPLNYDPDWDVLIKARGVTHGRLDWGRNDAVTARWYARPFSALYRYPCGVPTNRPERKHDLWVEVLEIRIKFATVSAATNAAVAAM